MSIDDACAGSKDGEVVLMYRRTGPARLCCTDSAVNTNVRNKGIFLPVLGGSFDENPGEVL